MVVVLPSPSLSLCVVATRFCLFDEEEGEEEDMEAAPAPLPRGTAAATIDVRECKTVDSGLLLSKLAGLDGSWPVLYRVICVC